MIKIIINTIKLLIKKKSFIAMSIVVPAIVIVFFSFTFGGNSNYKVGIIDKDNSYISNEIINTINEIENIDIVDMSNESDEMLLASHQIQVAVIINDGFSENVLNLDKDNIIVKSISNSDVKSILLSIIESKIDNINLIAKVSNNDIEVFKEYNETSKDKLLTYNINNVKEIRPSIDNSLGIVIMIVLISGITITNFLIEDEENNTKSRVLVSGINKFKYYSSLFIVFYLLSCTSSFIYYTGCKMLDLDFNMYNTINFFIVMIIFNLISISLNLCIVSFTRNRYVASTVNILIVIPTCMLSGMFWDFEVMPIYLQKIGSFLPQRWIYMCVENLQKYNNLGAIKEYILYMMILSTVFFSISLILFSINKKKV